MTNKFFPSRWPIMCAVMNGASDLNLAYAIHDAEAMPSLLFDRYNDDRTINYDIVNATLSEYQQTIGNCNLVLAVADEDLLDYKFLQLIKSFNVSHIEVLGNDLDASRFWYDKKFTMAVTYIRNFMKIMIRTRHTPSNLTCVDAYCIKGNESAGISSKISVEELFLQQRNLIPGCQAIPYGGIGSPQHVRNYLLQGAPAVAVGTLFAASTESCLSPAVKEKLCNTTSHELTRFSDTEQQALVLGADKQVHNDQSGWNRESSLMSGLSGDGNQGHVYVGKSVDYVKEIRSVKEIVDYLISDIKDLYE